MPPEFQLILPFLLIAAGAGLIGGFIAFFWAPGLHARSALQHFAAGVVIAAVASDLIPEVEKIGTPAGILGGFAAGGLTMIGLKWLVLKFEKREHNNKKLPVGLAVAAAVDTLIDGAIISAGFSTGQSLGRLLAVALALELFFLSLSVGSEFHKQDSTRWHGVVATTAIAMFLLIGAVGAFFLLRDASQPKVAIFLSFGAAALI